jgi:hypothetical protein
MKTCEFYKRKRRPISGQPRQLVGKVLRFDSDFPRIEAFARYPMVHQDHWATLAREPRTHLPHTPVSAACGGRSYLFGVR